MTFRDSVVVRERPAWVYAGILLGLGAVALVLPQPLRGVLGLGISLGGPTWILQRLTRRWVSQEIIQWGLALVGTLAGWSLVFFLLVADGVRSSRLSGLIALAVLLGAPALAEVMVLRRAGETLEGGGYLGRHTREAREAARTVPTSDATVSPRPEGSRNRFRADIQGLRAIAVLLVVLYHAGVHQLSGGYVGVDVFFVISGFLITEILLRSVGEPAGSYVLGFYARRVRRVLPAATLVLVVTAVFSFRLLGTGQGDVVADDARWVAGFVGNFRFIATGTNYLQAQQEPSPLQHFWSLAVEEQFYLVWPLIVLLVARLSHSTRIRVRLAVTLAVLIGLSLTWSYLETNSDDIAAYFSPLTRAWELGLGALVAVGAPQLKRLPRLSGQLASLIGIVVVVVVGFVFDAHTKFPGIAVAVPVVGSALIIAGGTISPQPWTEFVLRRRPVQWMGKVSYSFYLWHFPVLIIASEYEGRTLSIPTNLALCAGALVLAWLTFVVVEDPIRVNRWLVVRPQRTVTVGVALLVVAVTIPSVMIDSRRVTPLPAGPTAHVAAPDGAQIAAQLKVAQTQQVIPGDVEPQLGAINDDNAYATVGACDAGYNPTSVGSCVFGDATGTKTMVMIGDSHAAMWYPVLEAAALQAHWKLVILAKDNCPAPLFTPWQPGVDKPYTACVQFHDFTKQRIAELRPQLVVATGADAPGTRAAVGGQESGTDIESIWDAGDRSLINELRPYTAQTLILGDIPYLAQDDSVCLPAHQTSAATCATPRSVAVNVTHDRAEAAIAHSLGARYLNVVPYMCGPTICPAVVGTRVVYHNRFHVSATYAAWLSRVFANQLDLGAIK